MLMCNIIILEFLSNSPDESPSSRRREKDMVVPE